MGDEPVFADARWDVPARAAAGVLGTVKAMFFLPSRLDVDRYSHVVLTSQETLLALRDEPKLLDPTSETVYELGRTEVSLYQRFSDRFDLFPVDDGYGCRDHAEYVRRFAFQPSVNDGPRAP